MKKYQVNIRTRPGCKELEPREVRKQVEETLGLHNYAPCEVSVLFCGDKEIARLNSQYLGKNHPTDVLSFSQAEGESFPPGETALLGDIVISVPTARQAAKEYRVSVREEVLRLVIHGLLHLLGYDDENPLARKEMFKVQEELVKQKTLHEN